MSPPPPPPPPNPPCARRVDLVREGYDVALRAGADLEPGLVGRTIARTATIAVASPDYLESQGPLRKARDLRSHRCLVGFMRGGFPQTHWPKPGGGNVSRGVGSLVSNDIELLLDAALRGQGIA